SSFRPGLKGGLSLGGGDWKGQKCRAENNEGDEALSSWRSPSDHHALTQTVTGIPTTRSSLLTRELTRPPRVLGLDVDRIWPVFEHRAAAIEENAWLHDDARGRHIALDMGARSQLDNTQSPDTAEYLAEHLGCLDLDIRSHDAMLADLQAIAVENITLELAFDPQGSDNHQSSSESRTHSHQGARARGNVIAVLA